MIRRYACARKHVGEYEVTVGLGFDPVFESYPMVQRELTRHGFWELLQQRWMSSDPLHRSDYLRSGAEEWVQKMRPGKSWYLEIEKDSEWVQVYEADAEKPQLRQDDDAQPTPAPRQNSMRALRIEHHNFYPDGFIHDLDRRGDPFSRGLSAVLSHLWERFKMTGQERDQAVAEKAIRVKYQDIVYAICTEIDRRSGKVTRTQATKEEVLAGLAAALRRREVRVIRELAVEAPRCPSMTHEVVTWLLAEAQRREGSADRETEKVAVSHE